MNKEKQIPLAERLSKLDIPDSSPPVESLDVLSKRIPFFFQGIAALTGMRCHRENLECWSRWEIMEENRRAPKTGYGQPARKSNFHLWLAWSGIDLIMINDEEFFTNLLLEPMYWLEECEKTKKYETQKGDL